jgi:type IV pilus assembly protein PilX
MAHVTHVSANSARRQAQTGSVLIIGMLLLLLMTLLGLITTSETRTDARITSNNLDRAIAFQAAEAALREAERTIQDYEDGTKSNTNGDGFYDQENNDERPDDGSEWDTAFETDVEIPGVAEPPIFIIERLSPASIFGGYVVIGEVYHSRTNNVYRITVLSYGRSSDTQVIIQSTFVPANR